MAFDPTTATPFDPSTATPEAEGPRARPGESVPDWYMRTQSGEGARRLPDVLMGAAEPVMALSQMRARSSGVGVPQVEQVNQQIWDAYNKMFPGAEESGPALRRGLGQSFVVPGMPALRAGGLLATVAQGAGAGGAAGVLLPVYGATSDEDYWQKVRAQTGAGAVGGAILGPAVKVVGKGLAGGLDKAQQMLSSEGVRLTPGQALGGIPKALEDRFAGLPVIGDLIQKRRFEGIQDFNRAVYQRAVAPFGQEGTQVASTAEVGNLGIAKVGDYLSSKYEQALDRSVPTSADSFRTGLDSLSGMLAEKGEVFDKILNNAVYSKLTPSGTLTPSVAKAADSELGRLAASYRGSSVAADRELSLALREAQSELREAFASANPDTAPMIRAADQGWATLVQMERAGAMAGARDGIFTPAQLLNAIRRGDTSIRKRSYARREQLNEDFAQSAKDVLPSQVPDSGTVGRGVATMLAGELTGGAAGFPGAASSLITAGSIPYLPGVSPILTKMLTARPQGLVSLGELTSQASPYAGFAASVLGQQQ